MAVFFAPNAPCRHQPPSLDLSSVASPPPASQSASVSATAAAFTTGFPVSHEASPVAFASNAALHRALKRPRDDSPTLGAQSPLLGGRESWLVQRGLLRRGVVRGGVVQSGVVRGGVVCNTERWHQSVAEEFEQQGESSGVQQASEEALLEALLLQEEHRQQQHGGARSRAQRVLWPRVGSESALSDDVLLGCSSNDPAFIQRSALLAPPPTTQPHAALAAPPPPQLAGLSGSAPCIGDFAVQPVQWLRVGSESALSDDVLLGLCCEEGPASAQLAALSAPPPTQSLAAPMPLPIAGLPGPAPGSTSRCLTPMLAGSTCGTQEQEYVDACINMLTNINNTDNNAITNSNDKHSDKQSDKDISALFLDTPLAHVLLGGSPLAMPLASGPQVEGPPHQSQLHSQPLPQILPKLFPKQLLQLPTPAPGLSVPCQHPRAPLNAHSTPRGAHMQAPIQPRPAMLQQPFPTGALSALCSPILPPLPEMTVTSGGNGMP
ncbi:unnamed protein product [Closterium sp. Yama58-4]|nr:unnamed protein product [Closterium sp. Yama58-4]